MNYNEFMEKCIDMVIEYYNNLFEITDNYHLTEDDVNIVSMYTILNNHKALLSTNVFDGMYYEITFSNDENCFYFDGSSNA